MARQATSIGEKKSEIFDKNFDYPPNAPFYERALKEAGRYTLGSGFDAGALATDLLLGYGLGDIRHQRDLGFDDVSDGLGFWPMAKGGKFVSNSAKNLVRDPWVKPAIKGGALASGVQGARDIHGNIVGGLQEARNQAAQSKDFKQSFDNPNARKPAPSTEPETPKGRLTPKSEFNYDDSFQSSKFDRESMYKDVDELEERIIQAKQMPNVFSKFDIRDMKNDLHLARKHNADIDRKADIMDAGLAQRAGSAFQKGNFNELTPQQQLAVAQEFNLRGFRDEDGNLPVPKAPIFERQQAERFKEDDRREGKFNQRIADIPQPVLGENGMFTVGKSKGMVNPDGSTVILGEGSAPRQFDDNILEQSNYAEQSFPDYADHMFENTGVDPRTNQVAPGRLASDPFREPFSGLRESDIPKSKPKSYSDWFNPSFFEEDKRLTSRLNNQTG